MNRPIGEDDVIRLLRDAGRGVALDVYRIVDIIDCATRTTPVRARTRVGREPFRWRGPRRLLAVPLAAVLAGGVFVTVHAAVAPGPTSVRIVGPASTVGPEPAPESTATLGDAKSITAAPTPSSTGAAVPDPGTGGQNTNVGVELTVTPTAVGTPYRLPLHDSREWLLVGGPGGNQKHLPGGSAVGPAQVMGSGQAFSPGPFVLSWDASSGLPSGGSRDWLTAPDAVRGVPAALRVPVRVQQTSGTITLLAGAVGGGGKVRVEVSGAKGVGAVLSRRLPACSGDAVCPVVITITLDKEHIGVRGAEVMVELSASDSGARVGLAAVELD